jgi:hypothetical protein
MSHLNPPHYDFENMNRLLTRDYDPQEIGNELDETLCDLVHYAGKQEDYVQELPDRYFLIKKLRDIFWEMNKSK